MKNGLHLERQPLKSMTLGIMTLLFAVNSVAWSAPKDQLTSGTSSHAAKKAAMDSIPFHELTQETQTKISPILEKASIYRRLPITAIDVDPDYFVFLVRYPEVIVNIWKIMGVTKMVSSRNEPFKFATDDGAGTISEVELVYGTPNLHIFYGEGTYEGPVLKRKLNGSCVLVLRTEYRKSENGRPVATSQLDVFLKVENATAGLIARTLNPIVGKTADHNFIESLNFVQRLNETTQKNGPGVQQMANRLTDISTDVRQNFSRLAGMVFERGSLSETEGANSGVNPASYSRPATTAPSTHYQRQNNYVPPSYPPAPASYDQPTARYLPQGYQAQGYQAPRQANEFAGYQNQPPNMSAHIQSALQQSQLHIPANHPYATNGSYPVRTANGPIPPIVGPNSRQSSFQAPTYPTYNRYVR